MKGKAKGMSQGRMFFQIGSLIRVRHVQSEIGPSFDYYASLDEQVPNFFEEYFEGEDDWPDLTCLVTKDSEPAGWFSLEETVSAFGAPEAIGEGMYPIHLSQVVAADLPLFDAAEVLVKRHLQMLWVLDGNVITGTFSFRDLFKLPGVLCLFALAIELENAALDLCRCFYKECWHVLPEPRRVKANELWSRRHDKDASRRDDRLDASGHRAYYEGVIECTTFIDKATMIGKCKLLIDTGRNKLDSVFNRVEEVRNACAHPSENDRLQSLLPAERFVQFVSDCRRLIDSIRMVTPKK